MTCVPICTGTLSPHLRSGMTKNYTFSLYQRKYGIVRLAFMYPLCSIEMPFNLFRQNTSPIKSPSGRILNPDSVQNLSVSAEIWAPSIHKYHHLHPFYHNYSLIGMGKYLYQGIRVVTPGFFCQFAGTYWCPWLPWTWLCILGSKLEASTTSPRFPFKGVLGHLHAPCAKPLYQKHFIPLLSHHLRLFWLLPWPLVLHWFLLPFLTPPNCQELLVAVICGQWTATQSCVICSLRLTMSSLPSDWADHTWSPSPGWSSCSDSALQAAVMRWGYIIPGSSYR